MKKEEKRFPFVSIIIPTYNCANILKTCLISIRKQNYPERKYEILVIDGGSKDKTREVAKSFRAKIISNPKRDPETAKSLGIKQAKGEIVALVDSDNEIIKRDWLQKMVVPLTKDPELFGVESLYFSKKGESIFNTYSMLLHIADPFSRCIASKLNLNKKDGYIECIIPQSSAYPLGANGFFWNKMIIEKISSNLNKFEESNFSYYALGKGYRKFARVPGYGIYHNHISSLGDFINKRLKIGNKFLNRKDEKKKTWLGGVPKSKLVFSIIYCSTLIGPAIEGMANYSKTKQRAWLLHPFMSFISVSTYGYVFIKRKIINKYYEQTS